MPELPDIELYLEALEARIAGKRLEKVRVASVSLMRTAQPPVSAVEGRRVRKLRRVGKRIAIGLEGEHWLVLHLMIAGRLRWEEQPPPRLRGKNQLAAFDFESGSMILTEAGTRRRATLHVFSSERAMEAIDPGGLEVLEATIRQFTGILRSGNHTLKRMLSDPSMFSGIGNAYSDEILHRAGLSPVALSQKLSEEDIRRLFEATRGVLTEWIVRLSSQCGDGFPKKVTAFRKEMAVHGKYGAPCPVCGSPVQRIRHSENETNYCATCQTGGRILADRSLSQLLKKDWPRTIEEWEAMQSRRGREVGPT